MPAESSIVLLPRYTTLVCATTAPDQRIFTTLPLDVSGFGSAQFEIGVGQVVSLSGSFTYEIYLEESLDSRTWVLGASAPRVILRAVEDVVKFVSYAFRLRWFRLKIVCQGHGMMCCRAEGLLR